jgi:hypothetical protein
MANDIYSHCTVPTVSMVGAWRLKHRSSKQELRNTDDVSRIAVRIAQSCCEIRTASVKGDVQPNTPARTG